MGTGPSPLYENAHIPNNTEQPKRSADVESRFEYYAIRAQSHIEQNASKLPEKYVLHKDGYFCDRGTGKGPHIRQHFSENPFSSAQEFYDTLSRGGIDTSIVSGEKGMSTRLSDGTYIVLRRTTKTTDTPAVNLGHVASSYIRDQKVHFIKEH